MPNERLSNVFMAQTYDLGDPWRNTRHYYPAPYDFNTTEAWFGPIHQRQKWDIGRRLAMGINTFVYQNHGIFSGPLITQCRVIRARGIIRIKFHQEMLFDEEVIV
eukprot:315164_1